MKKNLLVMGALAAIAFGNTASAQTWSENFDGGFPAGWALINNDGLTPDGNVAYIDTAWVAQIKTDQNGNPLTGDSVMMSTSWYSPAGTADDWLISPQFNVTSANTVLKWDERTFLPDFPDGYEVRVSTTGTAISDFSTVIYSTTAAGTSFSTHGGSLSAFNGQAVYIAFRNNSNDKYLLAIDNVASEVAAHAVDVAVAAVVLPNYGSALIAPNGTTVQAKIKNAGALHITSVDLQYSIDGGTPVTQSFTGLNVGPYNEAILSFTTPTSGVGTGTHNITITATSVNGSADPNSANDQITAPFVLPSQSVTKACLMEEFTSSTCAPCASFNKTFDPLIASNNVNVAATGFNIIKYQMNWPAPGNDAAYNSHGAARRDYYGVNSIPDHFTNGVQGTTGDQAEIDGCKGGISYINITGTYTVKNDSIVANVSVEPYVTTSGNFRVHIAAVENSYTNNGATTSQKNYIHVMRRMFPNADGSTVSSFTSGTPATFNYKAKFSTGSVAQNNNNFWTHPMNSNLVVFVQDNDTKDIFQSAVIKAEWPVNVADLNNNIQHLSVAPNPASDNAILSVMLTKASNVKVDVVDAMGRVVMSVPQQQLPAGQQQLNLSVASLPTGLYTIMVQSDKGKLTQRLSVIK